MREIEALPAGSWQVWQMEKGGVIRVWAEVPYVPTRQYERRDSQPYRYLAIRVRRQQGELFEDGTMVRHFAVVSNRWDMEGQALLEWQRGKAGTHPQSTATAQKSSLAMKLLISHHSPGVNLCLGEDFPPLNSRPRCHQKASFIHS